MLAAAPLAAVEWTTVVVAVVPSVLTLTGAIVALVAARRRRRIDDAAAATGAEDQHAQAALDVLLATITSLREHDAWVGRVHAAERDGWDRERARLAGELDDARTGRERERRWKHQARDRAHYQQLRAEVAEQALVRAGMELPVPPPHGVPDPEPGVDP